MTEYSLILEACAPEALPLVHFTEQTRQRVDFALTGAERFDQVEITAPTRAALMETVAQFWGMDDLDWFYDLPARVCVNETRDRDEEEPQAEPEPQPTRDPFHVFAVEPEDHATGTPITVAADVSLDEGAILRTATDSSPLSSGVEHFVSLEGSEVGDVLDALNHHREVLQFNNDPTDEIDAVIARVERLRGYLNRP